MSSWDFTQLSMMLELVARALEAPTEAQWWAQVAEAVTGQLFGSEVLTVNVMNPESGYGWFSVVHPVEARVRMPVNSAMDAILVALHPFSLRLREGPIVQPLRVTDLVSPRDWRHHAAYDRMRELAGGGHHLLLNLPPNPPHVESVSVVRADRDFDDRDLARAQQLQAVLQLSLRHLRHVARRELSRGPAFEQHAANAARGLGISARERAVLDLLGAGCSTTSISTRLGIAATTVYKHESNLYRKLGATNRTDAVLRARRLGLVPDPSERPEAGVVQPHRLTARETAVLQLMSTGMTNGEIGDALSISAKTAGVHVGNVLHKLEARTRAEAVATGCRSGLVR